MPKMYRFPCHSVVSANNHGHICACCSTLKNDDQSVCLEMGKKRSVESTSIVLLSCVCSECSAQEANVLITVCR